MTSKRTELEQKEGEWQALQERSSEAEEAVKRSRDHYHAVTAGLSSGSEGQDDTLAAQKIGGLGDDPLIFGSTDPVLGRPV